MKPHLVRWHKELAEKGLVVIDVDDGKLDTQDALTEYVRKGEFPFPVLWDKGGKNVATYGVEGMPAAYLVSAEGKVVWEGHPNPATPEKYEALLKAELEKRK
jgi:hypothetical protein